MESDVDPLADTLFELFEEQNILIKQGETDTDTIVQIRVTVYYNEDFKNISKVLSQK